LRLLILVAGEGFLKDKCGPRAKMFEHHWSTHNHSVSDCSADWSTSDHSNRSWTNVARPWFLLRTDPASEKLGITSLSAGADYWRQKLRLKTSP